MLPLEDAMSMKKFQHALCRTAFTVTTAFLVLIAGLTLDGCGGAAGSSSSTPGSNPSATKTVVQINMGDSPADWILAFSMNINSMSLTGSNGTTTVVTSSTPMEMLHLMGTMQPLAMVNAPQGGYTGASITIGSVTVMYMDPTSKAPVQSTISGPTTANVTFPNSIRIGSTPMAMGFDLDLASSVTLGSNGNLTMSPVFHVTSAMQGSGDPMDPSDGGIQQMMGSVSSVSGSSFVMTSMQAAQNFAFATNSSTAFVGTSMSSMTNGMLLMVDAKLQADGSLMAAKVQSMMNPGGVMGGGIITAVTGNPATSLTLVMQNGVGTGMMSSVFASGITVALSTNTTFEIDSDNVDMAGLPFTPVFDQNHIYAGQSVMPISSSGMMSGGMGGGMMGGSSMAGTITATGVELEPQGLSGTAAVAVSSGATTSFTLNLPSDSAFTTLTGATSVTIFQQPQTVVGASPIAGGSSVHAFGLLFFDAGQWKLVASRIGSN
jgi:hypothetical protein